MLISPDFVADDPTQGADGHGYNLSTPIQSGVIPVEGWYSGVVNQTAYSTQLYGVDTIFCYPVVIGRNGVLDRIAFEVTTGGAAGSRGRCGIYRATSKFNIYPSALLVDGGDYDCTIITINTTIINTPIQTGLCWFCLVTGVAAPTCRRIGTGSNCAPIFGAPPTLGSTPYGEMQTAWPYAALPTTFPAGGTLLAAAINDPAAVHVRFSQ